MSSAYDRKVELATKILEKGPYKPGSGDYQKLHRKLVAVLSVEDLSALVIAVNVTIE